MSLVLLKLREGYTFGDVLLGGRVPGIHEPVQQPPPQQTQPRPAKTKKLEKLDIVHKDTPSSLITRWDNPIFGAWHLPPFNLSNGRAICNLYAKCSQGL